MSPDGDGTAVKDNVSNSTPAKDHRLVIDGLSLQKLDKLQSVVIDRLGGGGFGDWWVHGHKSSNDNRHLALEEVFALKRAIEDLNSTLAQQGRAPELLDKEIKANSKAAVTMNTKTKETMRNLVAQEMESKMRDISIKTERMENRQIILEKENKDLREALASLGAKIKKKCDTQAANNNQEVREMQEAIDKIKRESEAAQIASQEAICAIKHETEEAQLASHQRRRAIEKASALLKKEVTSIYWNFADRVEAKFESLDTNLKKTKQDLVLANRFTVWVIENVSIRGKFVDECLAAIREKVKWKKPAEPRYPHYQDPKYKEDHPDV